jgi:hypothetical protein
MVKREWMDNLLVITTSCFIDECVPIVLQRPNGHVTARSHMAEEVIIAVLD